MIAFLFIYLFLNALNECIPLRPAAERLKIWQRHVDLESTIALTNSANFQLTCFSVSAIMSAKSFPKVVQALLTLFAKSL